MASNTLNTRIKLKYDSISNWNSSVFIPLRGEACIAYIPNGQSAPNNYDVGNPDFSSGGSGLSPYAIGVKIGDGERTFAQLPWIQSIAGDVYGWAKTADYKQLPVTYGNTTVGLQQAITNIEDSIGGIVAANIDPTALSAALQQLQDTLSGESGYLFHSNYEIASGELTSTEIPTQLVRSISKNGLNISVTGSALTIADLPNIPLSKIPDLQFETTYDPINNKVVTKADLDRVTGGLTGAMLFTGLTYQTLPEITESNFGDHNTGDVILVGTKEYVYVKGQTAAGSEWILLGDEGSYAVKGSIAMGDLSSGLASIINGKADSTDLDNYVEKVEGSRLITSDEVTKLSGISSGAQVNVIEDITVNGAHATITNKTAEITVPITTIKSRENNVDTTITPTNYTVTFNPIAFDGDVKHLTQSDTILVINCGNATNELFAVGG